jgi:tetratricopeptide (TPR) repeat protein
MLRTGSLHLCVETGANHSHYLRNIGLVLLLKGDYDGALAQHKKALAVRESVLGKDHPETAGRYNNIGEVLLHKGDYDGALSLHKKALAIHEVTVGEGHPETAYNHIGGVLYDRALSQYKRH